MRIEGTRASLIPLIAFWGKLSTRSDETRSYHPQLCHMIDVGMVVRAMLRHVYPKQARKDLAKGLGISDYAVEPWITFVASLHDLGKASPAFQLRPAAQHLFHLYASMGPRSDNIKSTDAPHGRVTAAELPEILQKEFRIDFSVACRLASVIGGHHGTFPASLELDKIPSDAIGKKKWKEVRKSITLLLAELFEIPIQELPSACDHWTAMEIAGLVSVADWIGSNDRFFPYFVKDFSKVPKFNLKEYAQLAESHAIKALNELGWIGWRQPSVSKRFVDLFDIPAMRPLQETVVEIGDTLKSPGIIIIEAPMGEGKTEAALYLADKWGVAPGPRGFYVALPTQATSSQMFSRVRAFLEKRFSDSGVNLQLLHGHAALSAEFETMKKAFSIQGIHGEDDCGPHGSSVVAAEWFTYRKRGLLAPFGVGTVDQALLAVLQTRHLFVRLFGLAHKTVIIDEVHAYDAYMSKLLERLLEWLAALGSPVVLLSATLPKARQKAFLDAYLRGLNLPGSSDQDSAAGTSYPRICWAGTTDRGGRQIGTSVQFQRELKLEWANGLEDGENFPLGERLRSKLENGGCAAFICNTVGRAQRIYQALKRYFSPDELDLFHARYLFKDRDTREKRALTRFGKEDAIVSFDNGEKSKTIRPFRAVLVATQVIEQSLDLDFDLMVTDFAPVDLILQRSGRLHRHTRTRPQGLTDPTILICGPDSMDGDVPIFSSGTKAIYDPHILLRSWLALKDKRSIAIPEGIEELIESVYGDTTLGDALPEKLLQHWRVTESELRSEVKKMEFIANDVVVPDPYYPDNLFDVKCKRLEEDEPEIHKSLQALTRLTEPSASVVCLTRIQQEQFNLSSKPSPTDTREFLRHSANLSSRGIVWALLHKLPHPSWKNSPLLRHHRLLRLDESNSWYSGSRRLRLDAQLGIVIEAQ